MLHSKRSNVLLASLLVLVLAVAWQGTLAEDVVHAVSGIVKSVDKDTKTMVVKTSDGTEHTIKWTDKTTVTGVKDAGKGVAAGSVATYDGPKKAPRSRSNTPRRAARRPRLRSNKPVRPQPKP